MAIKTIFYEREGWNKFVCKQCKRMYWTRRYRKKSTFCSLSCSSRFRNMGIPKSEQTKRKISATKKSQQKTGPRSNSWKGGITFDFNAGYIRDNTNLNYQHRIVMEKTLGRKLKSAEIVHHIDGNGFNNNPENLEIMTRAQHANHHRKEILAGKGIVYVDK